MAQPYDRNSYYTNAGAGGRRRLHINSEGKIWISHRDDGIEQEVYTKRNYPEIYKAIRDHFDNITSFYISEFGHILIPVGNVDKYTIGRLREPLEWPEEYSDEQYETGFDFNEDYSYEYRGIQEGIGYTLSTSYRKIKTCREINLNLEIRSSNPIIKHIIKRARKTGRPDGGRIYVKQNGIIWGVLGVATSEEPPVYLGRLESDGNGGWKDWFPNNHNDVPFIEVQ